MSARGARIQLLCAAALFSTGGAAIKGTALSGWQVAGFRSGVAALALWAVLPEARRRPDGRMLLLSLAHAATLIMFVTANKLTTAANAIFLQSTAPLYLLVLGPLVLHEPVRRRDLGFLAIMAAGLALFFVGAPPAVRTAPDPATGNLLALGSGAAWAVVITSLRWLGRAGGHDTLSPIAVVALGNFVTCLACLPMALPVPGTGAVDWAVIAYLGLVQVGLAYVLMTRGLQRVGALEASVLLLVEPVLSPLWAWLVHGEVPGAWALAGGALIVGATLLRSWREERRTAASG